MFLFNSHPLEGFGLYIGDFAFLELYQRCASNKVTVFLWTPHTDSKILNRFITDSLNSLSLAKFLFYLLHFNGLQCEGQTSL